MVEVLEDVLLLKGSFLKGSFFFTYFSEIVRKGREPGTIKGKRKTSVT